MANRLQLFVSAGPELEPEREVIGQAIAKLPVSLGWVIKRTPHRNESFIPVLEEIEASDFFLLLFGSDIRAPVGWELRAARRAGKKPLAFLKNVAHTPAARIFLRETRIDWIAYDSPRELGSLVQKTLAEQILERTQDLSLNLTQLEAFSAFLEELGGRKPEGETEEAGRQGCGAGEGGVVLAPGGLPSEGVPIGERRGED